MGLIAEARWVKPAHQLVCCASNPSLIGWHPIGPSGLRTVRRDTIRGIDLEVRVFIPILPLMAANPVSHTL